MFFFLGKYESNHTAFTLLVTYSDHIIDTLEILNSLLDSEVNQCHQQHHHHQPSPEARVTGSGSSSSSSGIGSSRHSCETTVPSSGGGGGIGESGLQSRKSVKGGLDGMMMMSLGEKTDKAAGEKALSSLLPSLLVPNYDCVRF